MRIRNLIRTAVTKHRFARFADESGIAVPLVLAVLVVGLSLGSAAVLASVNVQRGSVRDEDSKYAIAAADAAVLEALHRQNLIPTTTGNRCLVIGSGLTLIPGAASADGWCPQVSGAVGDATWTYRVRHLPAVNGTVSMEVVGTGTSDGISRRVEVLARSNLEGSVFGNNTVIGDDFITLDSNSEILGSVGTNGDVTLQNNSFLCGNAQYGTGADDAFTLVGNAAHGGPKCGGTTYPPPTQGDTNLVPVFQGDVPTVNSNGRFFSQDLRAGSISNVTWTPATRTLIVDGNSSLTLGGTNYSLCRLELGSNSTLYIAAGAAVRIYFDSPENCGQSSGITQLLMQSNTRIVSSSGSPVSAALLFVGSTSTPLRTTRAQLNSNTTGGGPSCSSTFIIYGPKTEIELNSNATWCGAIAGKSVHLDSNSRVTAHPGTPNFTLPMPLLYQGARYVECVGTATTAPDQGC